MDPSPGPAGLMRVIIIMWSAYKVYYVKCNVCGEAHRDRVVNGWSVKLWIIHNKVWARSHPRRADPVCKEEGAGEANPLITNDIWATSKGPPLPPVLRAWQQYPYTGIFFR